MPRAVGHDLETPPGGPSSWPNYLYRAKAPDIPATRPVFTGDIFADVPLLVSGGEVQNRTVMVIQHPCAIRSDGMNLNPVVLVCEVRNHRPLEPQEWRGFTKLMSLPDLLDVESNKRHQAVMFDRVNVCASSELLPDRRLVCLTQMGVNLLLQRWNHHSSRAVVPTWQLDEVTSGPFEEADLAGEWCDEAVAVGIDLLTANSEFIAWMRADLGDGATRQKMITNPQLRSRVRQEIRSELQSRYRDGFRQEEPGHGA